MIMEGDAGRVNDDRPKTGPLLDSPSGMTTRSSSPAMPRAGYRVVEVSGRPFAIEMSWLRPYEASKLYRTLAEQEGGVAEIVSDTVLFGIVVEWLRTGVVELPPEVREEDVEAEFDFLGLPYPSSTSVCRETLDLETMRYALKDMVHRAVDDADDYCKENHEVDSELVVLVIVREVVERAVTTSHWVGISMADLPKRLWEVLHSVTREASEVIADRISDTLSSVYGLKIKSVKLDFRPFEEDPGASTQCDCCGCEVGRDSNWSENMSGGDVEAERSRDRCDRRTIEANQRDRFNAPPFEETMDWCYACLHKFYPAAVTITTDPGLMDAAYLAAAIQKAASLRKHDVVLWRGFTGRLMELIEEIPPEHIGYVLWGYGKALYLPSNAKEVYLALFDRARMLLPQLSSHAIMATLWTMKRVQIQPHKSDLMEFAKHVMERRDSIRPTDFCKIANCLAFFGTGKHNSGFRKQFSEAARSKYDEELFAQGFRAVVSPTAMYTLWNDTMRTYVLERFRRVQQTARPNHLHAAYLAAVICRVHNPGVWFDLSLPCRQFYTRLSMRHIPYGNIKPGPLHQDVSNHLAELQVTHRNSFRWGPFAIDIGIESKEVHDSEEFGDDRKKCIFIDGPTQFYFGTNDYLESVKMYHSTLSSLGWMVYRLHWMEWSQTYDPEGGGKAARLDILRRIVDSYSASDTLLDGESREIGRKDLKRFKWLKREMAEKASAPAQDIEFAL
ncbi:hypothetical protein FOZ61_004193 [Perkinsus olseni]|uniref:RAP domain-containing protein n=1 Tax=Perkinsus olseni TaxID=32597 RepID=A0A7J6ME41_PEROL|nr:hypothetical protein FOZ61_004193 [Perkinsus olseni]